MTIEFRCIRCGQLLRVSDDDQGKRARCPSCNAIVDIPGEDLAATAVMMSREKSDVIDYELFGDESQFVEITLDPGEITVARMEHLLHMTPGVAMENAVLDDSNGGILERISQVGRRLVTGNSLRMTAFCNVAEQREVVAFAPAQSSRLIPMHLDEYDKQMICRGDAILCVARGIEIIDVELPAVSDVIPMCQINGDGIAVLQAAGQLFHRELKAKKTLTLRTESIVAFTSDVRIDPHESVAADDQIPISKVSGPGEIWLKTGSR